MGARIEDFAKSGRSTPQKRHSLQSLAKSQEPKAKSQKPKAKSQKPKAKSQRGLEANTATAGRIRDHLV